MSIPIWQLQKAKSNLSELIRACRKRGPQMVSVRGIEKAVVISKKDYDRLTGTKPNFIEFMNKSPLKGIDLNLDRDRSLDRDIDLDE